jgi:hypothetical protein
MLLEESILKDQERWSYFEETWNKTFKIRLDKIFAVIHALTRDQENLSENNYVILTHISFLLFSV